jgi:predicted transcriptional regulator
MVIIIQNLSMTQREILIALLDIYNRSKRMVKSKEVADMIGKDEGTVRNIILSLKVLGLVESKPGPSGGYIPTLKAMEVIKAPSSVPLYDRLSLYKGPVETDIKILNIELLDITNPNSNRVLLKVLGDLKQLRVGDKVRVGPTPYSRLVIEGIIVHMDEMRKEVIIDVVRMVSVPRERIRSLVPKRLIVLRPEMTLREASQLLLKEGIRGAPVVSDKEKSTIVGILTSADIIRAFYEGKLDAKVKDYMKTEVIMIRDDDDLLDAIRKMITYNVGRLIVTNALGELVGIVTRTDILKRIAGLEGTWTV